MLTTVKKNNLKLTSKDFFANVGVTTGRPSTLVLIPFFNNISKWVSIIFFFKLTFKLKNTSEIRKPLTSMCLDERALNLLPVFSVTPLKIDQTQNHNRSRIKPRIWGMKGAKYAKILAKFQVKAIFHDEISDEMVNPNW